MLSNFTLCSYSPIVGTPLLDCFFDVGGGELLVQCAGGQGGKFGVGGEAQSDELRFGKFRDAGTKSGIEQGREAQSFFQADDAVLYFEGVEANLENGG